MKKIFNLFLILLILITGCSGNNNQTTNKDLPMNQSFNEPSVFPFVVNEMRTVIDLDDPSALQQYVFHYKNKQTTQEIRYILSKVINEPEKVSKVGKQLFTLKSGEQAYYEEDETSQSIWWESENGFLARFVYYINGNLDALGEYKLNESDLIDLANQVQ